MTDTLARLRRLEAAATPGEWVRDGGALFAKGHGYIINGRAGPTVGNGSHDAALIAAARNALPQLLAIAEAAAELYEYADQLEQELNDPGGLPLTHGLPIGRRYRAALAALDSQENE